ncbi:MAG: glycosyltransferase family 2 protein, partial [Chitinophagaceae bacterium]
MIWQILFFAGIFFILYTYAGYSLFVYILLKIRNIFTSKKESFEDSGFEPPVTLVIAAFNEEDFVATKIKNSLELDYPADKLEIIFVTDGSTDRTVQIVAANPRVTLQHSDARRGKIAAIHRVMPKITNPITIFSDANTLLNKDAVRNIVRHYADQNIGAVSGEKKVIAADTSDSNGEGAYWKYESALKQIDSDFYTVVGAAGELFSLRTELYTYPGDNVLLDDFILSMRICEKGYRVVYE